VRKLATPDVGERALVTSDDALCDRRRHDLEAGGEE
jgi:hypothetical protein